MKTNLFKAITLCGLISLASCDKDGDIIYLSPLEDTTLESTSGNIILTKDNANDIVMSLVWNGQDLVLSDTTMSVPDLLSTYIAASLTSTMDNCVTSLESSVSKAYTGMELNVLAKNLGVTPDMPTSVFFSVMNSVGANIDPEFSNVVEVKLTSYLIDMKKASILNTDKADTGLYLYSPEENGIYKGFMGATSWYNFYISEGDGKIWGNEGVAGSEFLIASEDYWNMWFPAPGGCYYTTINTSSKQWEALYVHSLTLGGDLQGDMIYDRPNNKWIYAFNANTSDLNITVSGQASKYNYATGTDDDKAIAANVAFSGNAESLSFSDAGASFVVNVPASGECSLILDLSDPSKFVCSVVSGSAIPDEISEYIWISGIDDGITGNWTFDNYAVLYDEDKLAYAGVANVNSLWGYKIYTEFDNWGSAIGTDESGLWSEGNLVNDGISIPQPESGLYLLNFGLKDMKYNIEQINSVSFAGFNDNWNMTEMTETETPGVFSSELTINQVSPYGCKVYLNGNWDLFFGGADGKIIYQSQGIADDQTLGIGTYIFTVDLIKGTYTLQ